MLTAGRLREFFVGNHGCNLGKVILRLLLPLLLGNGLCSCYHPVVNPLSPSTEPDGSNAVLRANTLALLNRVLASNIILSGQQCGHVGGGNYSSDWLQAGGRKAAVMGIDLGYEDCSGDYSGPIRDAQAHAAAGGIVTLSFHPRNPATGGDVKARGGIDFAKLLSPDNVVYSNWRGVLQNVGNVLQALEERHVIVLWRPLHEMNADWFWWGAGAGGPTVEQFTALWKDMHRYFTVERRLDNLIWVYAANYRDERNLLKPVAWFYPGPDYVDLVGLDAYADPFDTLASFQSSYTELKALGKPTTLCEVGPDNLVSTANWNLMAVAGLRDRYAFAYALVWHSWSGHPVAIRDNSKASLFMSDARVISLDELPPLY